MSKPIKIYKRKDGTYYVQFERLRYNIDIAAGNTKQYIDYIEDAKKRIKFLQEECPWMTLKMILR